MNWYDHLFSITLYTVNPLYTVNSLSPLNNLWYLNKRAHKRIKLSPILKMTGPLRLARVTCGRYTFVNKMLLLMLLLHWIKPLPALSSKMLGSLPKTWRATPDKHWMWTIDITKLLTRRSYFVIGTGRGREITRNIQYLTLYITQALLLQFLFSKYRREFVPRDQVGTTLSRCYSNLNT